MENKDKFLNDMANLLAIAKTNNDRITKQEIKDYFDELSLSEKQLADICDYITACGVQIPGYQKAEQPVQTAGVMAEDEEDALEDEVAVKVYLQELEEKKQLDLMQEEMVAAKMLSGDEHAKNLLIEAKLGIVPEIAKEYKHQGMLLGDLIQEGNIGLLNGVATYERLPGTSFHAHVEKEIRSAIMAAIEENNKSTQSAKKVASKINQLNDLATELATELEREATPQELAEQMNITEEEVRELMKISLDAISVIETGVAK